MTESNAHTNGEALGKAIAAILNKMDGVKTVATPDGIQDLTKAHLLTMPQDHRIHDITDTIHAALETLQPMRRRGTAIIEDLDSLIGWTNRFKGDTSVLYADPYPTSPSLMCIANYHDAGPEEPAYMTLGGPARHGDHRAVYKFPLSDEWQAWRAVSGTPMEKDDLGEFIENNAKDILDPSPAVLKGKVGDDNADWENRLILTAQKIEGRYGQLRQLLAMSRKFQVYETSDLKIVSNRDTGEGEIQFLNEHKTADGKPLNIPNLIIIAIPVFQGGALYRMPVRFRYRKQGGSVRFILTPYAPERALKDSFKSAVETASKATKLPVFYGRPES